jgi:hypothetical protein
MINNELRDATLRMHEMRQANPLLNQKRQIRAPQPERSTARRLADIGAIIFYAARHACSVVLRKRLSLTNIQEHAVDKYEIAGIRFSWAFIWSVTQ